MYAKFFKAAERRKKAQTSADESHNDDSTLLKKTMPLESYNSRESGINKVCSDDSIKTEMENISQMMENSLHISKPLVRSIKTNIMFLKEGKLAQSTIRPPVILHKTGNYEKDVENPPSVSSKIAIKTESQNNNSMKPVTNLSHDCSCSGQSVIVDSGVITSVDTTISTNTHDITKVMKNSLNGSNSKIEDAKMTIMDSRRTKLDRIKKVPVGANEKGSRKDIFPTEGSKTVPDRPTEVMENRIHETKTEKQMVASKMVHIELSKGNLTESSNMLPRDLSDFGELIFQTEPKYVRSLNTSEHMFSTEGSKTVPDRPTEVMENEIHGTKKKEKKGAFKMVQMEGNLAESSNMPPMDLSDIEKHIFQTKPKYVPCKNISAHMFSEAMRNRIHETKEINKEEAAEMVHMGLSKENLVESSKMPPMDLSGFGEHIFHTEPKYVPSKNTSEHVFSAEGSKTVPDRPTEVMENDINGTKKITIMGMGLSKENLVESSKMPPMDLSGFGEHIFQTEPKYVPSKNTSEHVFSVEGSKTVPDRPTEVMENDINGTKKITIMGMGLCKENLVESSKMPPMDLSGFGEHIFQTEPKYVPSKNTNELVFSAEGIKTVPDRPTEVMENYINGTKKMNKMGAARMVHMGLSKGNLAESSKIPPMDRSGFGDHIFQTEPKYESSKCEWRRGLECFGNYQKSIQIDHRSGEASKLDVPPVAREYKNKESHMDVTNTHVSQQDREKMRSDFNKLVQKRNPEVRQITNTLENPLLFDILLKSVEDMDYNGGKNPLAVLNELKPNLDYHIEKFGPQHKPSFKVSVNIDGQIFSAVANTKKGAKINTAAVALKMIGDKRTLTHTRTKMPKNVESTNISRNRQNYPSTSTTSVQSTSTTSVQSTSTTSVQSTSVGSDKKIIPPGQSQNPVSALNTLKQGLKYQCIAKNGPSHLPHFIVKVRIDEKVYCGSGGSKKLAKADAARKALMCINAKTNNLQEASLGSKEKKNTSNITTTSANKQDVAMAVPKRKMSSPKGKMSIPKGKPPFAVLNDLYPNATISWTRRCSNVSFTITVEGRNFTGAGLNMKSARNNAAVRALHELRGFSPTHWENH